MVSLHMQINVMVMCKMIFCGVYVPGKFKNPDTSKNAVLLEQYAEGYIKLNADIESRP